MAKYILFDTETTGTLEEDKIIQIGGMIVSSKTDIECFDELCSTNVPIKIEAMEVHNITPELLSEKPCCQDTKFYKKIIELNNNENYLIAHNVNFDLSMLQKEGFENKFIPIDTLRCSKHLFPQLSHHRLQYIRYALELYKDEQLEAEKLNITIKAHDAIGDVLIMKLFLSKLVAKCFTLYPDINPMKKLANLTQTPVIVKTFKFGKYKDRDIIDIAKEDLGYLNWMITNMKDLDEDIRYTINEAIQSIN
ncbi:Exonuclease [hydrothermal vent metagenome]|uniref:Exonuclease n=1 Tax=hydrothermal vent metagenome TaxID=652676 RepID=A0A3B1E9L9_9ZZZZ